MEREPLTGDPEPFDTASRWRTCDPQQILWAEFDDEFVIYHAPSGKTHFLNSGSGYLLRNLLERPHTLSEIVLQFSPEGEREDHSSRDGVIADTLLYFEELGLVERA
jgi:PqqD family protein of HPr-rel-A system